MMIEPRKPPLSWQEGEDQHHHVIVKFGENSLIALERFPQINHSGAKRRREEVMVRWTPAHRAFQCL